MNVRLVRNGELPPGVVDGYCTACSGDVLVSGPDYACPTCETPVHPDSLPREARLAVLAGGPAAKAIETAQTPRAALKAPDGPPAARPRLLTPTREALAWDRATDDLLAAAERRAAETQAAAEQAKAAYEAAVQELHWLRQVRGALAVKPKPEGVVALPPPAGAEGKPWAKAFAACRICGDDQRKHMGRGRCTRCAMHVKTHGLEWPDRKDKTDGN